MQNGLALTRVTKPDGNRKEVNRNEILFEVTKAPEGGYDAQAVGYCIFIQGEDRDDLKNMVQDAVRCHCPMTLPRDLCRRLVRRHGDVVTRARESHMTL